MSAHQRTLTFDEQVGRKLEAISGTPDMIARRQAVFEAVQPRPGEYGLDIGPGPGLVTCELAQCTGRTGRVTIVDTSPAMLAMTQQRARQLGVEDWVEVHEGSAVALPFPDSTFDFVVAAEVYEYVPDIGRALVEAYRVLRPGGRLAIVDTDWGTLVIHTDNAALTARVNRAWDEHLSHHRLPHRLPKLLGRAGFQLAAVKLVPVLSIEYDSHTYGFELIGLIADFERGRAGIAATDVDAWLADIERQQSCGSYFFSLNQYLFRAIRPDAERGI